jgi:hypothetical protein
MKLVITPTDQVVIVPEAAGARVWEGTTEKGTRVLLYVAALAVPQLTCDEAEMAELVEITGCEEPSFFSETEFVS